LHRQNKALSTTLGYVDDPTHTGLQPNRSNCHVDAECGSPAITLTPPKRNSLTHIPGDEGWPLIGKTLEVLADPKGRSNGCTPNMARSTAAHVFGETSINLLGPEANELLLFDQAKQFSSTHGWGMILGRPVPARADAARFRGAPLHRRALSVAFKIRTDEILSQLARCRHRRARRAVEGAAGSDPVLSGDEQLTLDLAATSFLGADIGPEVDEVTNAFVDHGGRHRLP